MKKSFSKKNIANVLICILILLLGLQCTKKEPETRNEFRIASPNGNWGYPNPYLHYPRGPGYVMMSLVFDTLVWKDETSYIPALADFWEYDASEKQFIFSLNRQARWHDGKEITAEDIKFTIEYFQKYPYQWVQLGCIRDVVVLEKHKVAVRLNKEYSPFVNDIAGTLPIIPRHIWENVTEPDNFTAKEAFIGSGPYHFIDYNKAQGTYLYEANKEYYRGKVKVDRLIYIKAGKPILTLSTGAADMVSIQPEMKKVLEDKGMRVVSIEHSWNKKLMINHRKAPFNDKKMRHALAYAINRQEIIDKSQHGFAELASLGLLSAKHEFYNPQTPDYPCNPVKAQEILQELGYEKNSSGFFEKNGEEIKIELIASLMFMGGEQMPDRDGEIIKQHLEKAGIKADLKNLEQGLTDAKVKNFDFDLVISGHGGISGDAIMLNSMISSKYGTASVNCARFDENKTLNTLLEQQLYEMNQEQRKQTVYKIQQVYADELPAISLYCPALMTAYNPDKGITWFSTTGGIARGVPLVQNKIALIEM